MTQGQRLFVGELQFTGQAGSGFALSDPAQEQDERRRLLATLFKGGAGQNGKGSIAIAAALARKGLLGPK